MQHELESSGREWIESGIFILISVLLLYLSSLYNYLLFHSFAEIFSICIAFTFFLLSWNSRKYLDNGYLIFLGIAYLSLGILDLLHTLSYKGMAIFKDYDFYANQLWIATRFLESISILLAFIFLLKKRIVNWALVFIAYFVITSAIILSIFYWKIFPICFVEGIGLTRFKVVSEYVISSILMIDILLLANYRELFDKKIFSLLLWSFIFTIGSELAFTFYISNYGFSNLVGHYFKIFSFYLMYKAIIEKGIKSPYDMIFRELKQNQAKLELLTRVDGLTGLFNHVYIITRLDEEIARHNRYKSDLSIIMLDIDFFKKVNDTYGHSTGDEVLKAVAKSIQESIRDIDIAGRYGGEEFIVILPNCNLEQCYIAAERTREAIQEIIIEKTVKVTISAGIAQYVAGSSSEFIIIADDKLYAAKRHGKNRIEK